MNGKLRNMTSLYLIRGEKVLLLFRQGGKVVNNVWVASAGGHFENYELNDAKACALRELQEELGISSQEIDDLSLRYITLRWTNREIRQNYYFFAELKDTVSDNLVSNEGICQWFSLQEALSLEMPISAKYVMNHFCETGRYTSEMYVGITNKDGVQFTKLSES